MNGPWRAGSQVEGVGDQFLAGAVLALDQNVGVAGRHRLDQLEQLAHLLALADDARERILTAHLFLKCCMLLSFDIQRQRARENVRIPSGSRSDFSMKKNAPAGPHREPD